MPLSTSAVGAALPRHEQAVTVREILAYSAGLGLTADPVFDDAAQGLMAFPAYCVRLEWPVVSAPEVRQLWGGSPQEMRRGVHATQDSIFHRPIRPGEDLVTEGQIMGLEGTRAGALTTIRLETATPSGEVVVTSWSRSILRGVEVKGEPQPGGSLPPLPAVEEEGGEVVSVAIAREMPHVYTECARIWNPIHTEREVALAAGLPDIILHGTATWALAGREAVRLFCDGRPERLKRLHGRFTGMVIPGNDIEIHFGEPAEQADGSRAVGFMVKTHEGDAAMRAGVAVVDAE